MKKKRLLKYLTLTAFTISSLSVTTLNSLRSDTWQISQSQKVWAQTSEEIQAKQVCDRGSAVVTIKNGKGHGSGFVVSSDGLIITNAHVVADGPEVVTVVFEDGKQLAADVIGFANGGVDLAALQIYNQKNLPALALAKLDYAKRGYNVFAIGTPLDPERYPNTCTQGYISRIHKDGMIQHNADTNQGNSGEPLLNSQGQVIGVNTLVATTPVLGIEGNKTTYSIPGGNGINLTLPIEKVNSLITDIRNNRTSKESTVTKREKPSITNISLDGRIINGSLVESDLILEGKGNFVDLYSFQGQAGQQVTIDMKSQKINPVLTLYQLSPEGEPLQEIAKNDDKGPGNFNSEIIITLPNDGLYNIAAQAFERGETGDYSLRAIAKP